jgi:hypothetical protein
MDDRPSSSVMAKEATPLIADVTSMNVEAGSVPVAGNVLSWANAVATKARMMVFWGCIIKDVECR